MQWANVLPSIEKGNLSRILELYISMSISGRMNMKRFWFVITLSSLYAFHVCAQSDVAQFSHYFTTMSYYNPAYAGKNGDLNLLALYRLQWLGIRNAPQSMVIAADMPWKLGKSQHGLGVVAMNESLGLEKNLYISAQYAYKKKLGKGILSLGLQAGLVSKAFSGDSIYIPESEDHEPDDEALVKSQADAMGLDLAAGLFYHTPQFYVGVGIMHLLESTLELDENMERKIEREYNLTAGYNIQLQNPLIELHPSIFVQTNLQMTSMDITARMVYNKMFNGGLGCRMGDNGKINAAIFYLGATIKGFRIGYAYEFPTSAILKGSIGSHELMATYGLKLDKSKGNKNKHKSVRIL
jgi:type IX secretion system PorP/SprF family membrane protein